MKSPIFGGFRGVKSERKVRLTQTWCHLIDLTELYQYKPFHKLLNYCGINISPKTLIFEKKSLSCYWWIQSWKFKKIENLLASPLASSGLGGPCQKFFDLNFFFRNKKNSYIRPFCLLVTIYRFLWICYINRNLCFICNKNSSSRRYCRYVFYFWR